MWRVAGESDSEDDMSLSSEEVSDDDMPENKAQVYLLPVVWVLWRYRPPCTRITDCVAQERVQKQWPIYVCAYCAKVHH